jgi:hypothetical protein
MPNSGGNYNLQQAAAGRPAKFELWMKKCLKIKRA